MNVFLICPANASRSFLAEMRFRHKIEQQNLGNIFIASAGIDVAPG